MNRLVEECSLCSAREAVFVNEETKEDVKEQINSDFQLLLDNMKLFVSDEKELRREWNEFYSHLLPMLRDLDEYQEEIYAAYEAMYDMKRQGVVCVCSEGQAFPWHEDNDTVVLLGDDDKKKLDKYCGDRVEGEGKSSSTPV